MLKHILKIFAWMIGVLLLLIIIGVLLYPVVTRVDEPQPNDLSSLEFVREKNNDLSYSCENSWLRQNQYGLWELYIEGDAFERGVQQGILMQEMIEKQERAFLNQIGTMIPSSNYQKFLKYFVSIFNRNLDDYIPMEYQLEIYGISQYASDEFSFIGPNFLRILNYHAAHDIGHALQNMNLVACTAFGGWDSKTDDGSMIIGRNFDFYVGDEFAEDKIVAFIKPDSGHPFMMVTWAGMIGVVSGMNDQGLTVTLNAAKSSIPSGAKTPVSILGREILQYASTIDEAFAIASQTETFVSEMFLIGSSNDGKAVVIEKTPEATHLFDPGSDHISVTNHFQSEALKSSALNIENIENETSAYRLSRTEQLVDQPGALDEIKVAALLRNYYGMDEKDIGLGNEKAINQFIAHHGIIFKPDSREVWVSAHPYQLGRFVHYNLDTVFSDPNTLLVSQERDSGDLEADPFIASEGYIEFQEWRKSCLELTQQIKNESPKNLTDHQYITITKANPNSYFSWWILGQHAVLMGDDEKAIKYFNFALERETASAHERVLIEESLNSSLKRLNNNL